jgi:hypothetical protein
MVGVIHKRQSIFFIQHLSSIFLQIILFIHLYFFGCILYISFFINPPLYSWHHHSKDAFFNINSLFLVMANVIKRKFISEL